MGFRRLLVLTAALVALGMVLFAPTAGAVDDPDYTSPPPTTQPGAPTTTTAPVQEVRKVPTAVNVTPVRSRLAITGSDVGQLAAIGAVLVLAGGVVLVLRNGSSAAEARRAG